MPNSMSCQYATLVSLAVGLTALPALAAEPAHCYLGDPPADAPLSTVTPAPMSGYRNDMALAAARHGCEADIAADRAFLTTRRAKAGCSEGSEIADFTTSFLDQPSDAVAAMMLSDLGLTEAGATAFCARIAECTPGEEGYSEDCHAAFRAAGQ